jgi:hypothetical protein
MVLSKYILGLDPAQLHDWSALAAIKMEWNGTIRRYRYSLVAMERRQQVPYDEIVEWATAGLRTTIFQRSMSQGSPELVLDATGVGIAIKDMFQKTGVPVKAVTITVGNGWELVGSTWHLGKARLIGTFLGVLDSGRLQVNPNLPIWSQLERELVSYRAEISAQGHAKFEAAPGEHDDLLFALALAIFWAERQYGNASKVGAKPAGF